MNVMKNIRIEKVTLNVGAGKEQPVLKKGIKLINNLTGVNPIQTITRKRIPSWGIRPGLPVGCKLTLRGEKGAHMLKRMLNAKSDELKPSCFDENGNIAFGVPEYIDILDVKYDPEIGIMGLEVAVTLMRPGFRVKNRRIRKSRVSQKHKITRDEAIEFMKKEFNIKIGDEE